MVELPEKRGEGDLRRLSQTFNTMTRELKTQRDALVTANEQLVERRHFMEAVLSGVSAGVIGLDSQDRITLVSRAAVDLLGMAESDLVGKKLKDTIPAFGTVLDKEVDYSLKARSQDEVTFYVGGEERTFAVMVTRERASGGDVGSVVTFDDVTDLVVAQRTAAWADVARRIAHEIKNPLTPIQLSAERLRRKYAKNITARPRDVRPADDDHRAAGRPTSRRWSTSSPSSPACPSRRWARTICATRCRSRWSCSAKATRRSITSSRMPDKPLLMSFDRRLITRPSPTSSRTPARRSKRRASTALQGDPNWKGRVETIVTPQADRVTIEVIDNGIGLPKQNRARLLEPYVTTKGHKGTGLGLAMVQKITEQHGGTLSLEDAPPAPGARARCARAHHPAAASAYTGRSTRQRHIANRTSRGPPRPDETTKEL